MHITSTTLKRESRSKALAKVLIALALASCGEQCQVLAAKVVTPIRTWRCSVVDTSVSFQIVGGGPLDDVSSNVGRVICYEVVLP